MSLINGKRGFLTLLSVDRGIQATQSELLWVNVEHTGTMKLLYKTLIYLQIEI